jgi:hypothetical protein
MGRWLVALAGDRVLGDAARTELFRPRVREEPGGDTRYAFGWVVAGSPYGTVDWHNGGNGWSYAEIARLTDHDAALFWVTSHARSRACGWNLERGELTGTVGARLAGQ